MRVVPPRWHIAQGFSWGCMVSSWDNYIKLNIYFHWWIRTMCLAVYLYKNLNLESHLLKYKRTMPWEWETTVELDHLWWCSGQAVLFMLMESHMYTLFKQRRVITRKKRGTAVWGADGRIIYWVCSKMVAWWPPPDLLLGIVVHWKKKNLELSFFFWHSYISFVESHIEYSK